MQRGQLSWLKVGNDGARTGGRGLARLATQPPVSQVQAIISQTTTHASGHTATPWSVAGLFSGSKAVLAFVAVIYEAHPGLQLCVRLTLVLQGGSDPFCKDSGILPVCPCHLAECPQTVASQPRCKGTL